MPKKQKTRKTSLKEEEKPSIAVEFQEELDKTESFEKSKEKAVPSNFGKKIKDNINNIKEKDGVIGFILRNSTSATIDLKDPSKIIEYAVLSSTSLETSEELASSFKIGEAKFILVEGENSKVLSFNIDENRVSIFMDKTVDHKKIFKELTH